MAIKVLTYEESVAIKDNSPDRKYRELRDGTIVLEREAEELCNGERKTLSVAYKLMNKSMYPSEFNQCKLTLAEITDPKKLERIALFLVD